MDERTVVLFDGSSWSGWLDKDGKPSTWKVLGDGTVQAGGGDTVTGVELTDFQLHVEFLCPVAPGKEGQARSNSGVYLHGRYEVQVLDTYGQDPAMNGCGAIYSIAPPQVNASRPAGEWQTYDIMFRAPRVDASGTMTKAGSVTVLHNGIAIHNNVEVNHTTPGGIDGEVVASGPLLLQDHGDPVLYRNIWARRLDAE